MLSATAKITNKRGLHARASAKVVEAAAHLRLRMLMEMVFPIFLLLVLLPLQCLIEMERLNGASQLQTGLQV